MSILEHSILQLTGADGTAEFNVDPDQKMFKLTMGKETRKFSRLDLWALVFAMSDTEQQEKMIPVRQTEVVTYRRIHNIKVKKPLKPGDMITCKCEINVPQTVVEGLNGMIEQQEKKALGGLGTGDNIPIIGATK